MEAVRAFVGRVKRPEYTGANRCHPCTVANCAIVVISAIALAWISRPLGALALGVGLATVWLRGYVVPGTPRLTKRYFPTWLLARFGTSIDSPGLFVGGGARDLETTLLRAGIVHECVEFDDLCLDRDFRERWRERIASVRGESIGLPVVAEWLDLGPEEISISSHDGVYAIRVADGHSAQWESRAALVADLAAAQALSEWLDGWESLPLADRARLLGGLRIFLETCPACDGAIDLSEERVESCCSSHDVVAGSCASCGSRVLEAVY